MTDQEAYKLIGDALQLLRDAYHWGTITIEVSEGKIKRVNLTTNLKPKDAGGRMQDAG